MLDDFSNPFEDHWGDRPAGLEDMVLMGNTFFRVAVPATASPIFKRYVVAAAQTVQLRNVSVDHVLRTYNQASHVAATEDAFLGPVRDALRDVKQSTRAAFEIMHHIHKPAHPGATVSWAALYRLQSTIRCICFATVHGFHFESSALQRLMLEQLAWVSAVRSISDVSYFDVEPQACLSSLKELFPDVGRVYGRLSRKAHLTPEETKVYISSDESGQLSAHLWLRRWAPNDAVSLLSLADMYIVLSELIVADLLTSRTSIRRVRGVWVPKRTRPFLRTARRHARRLVGTKAAGSAL